MMTSLQQSILNKTEAPILERNQFTPQPDELPPATTSTPPSQLAEPQAPTQPVWNGELDEPIWW